MVESRVKSAKYFAIRWVGFIVSVCSLLSASPIIFGEPKYSFNSEMNSEKLLGQVAAASKSGSISAFSKCARAKPLRYDIAKLTFRSSSPNDRPIDLTGIPEEYHDFANVFSKVKANKLPPHRPYNLKINIEEGSTPPLGLIYSLLKTELEALREFLDENIANGFIRPTRSPYGAPILFVKKKEGALYLCVDFHGLNKLTKKDLYPIPLTSDLLDSPKNACIYTKIDLHHTYHLVRITKGDEWKTVFRTWYGLFNWLVMPFRLLNGAAG